jgi:hypothetical protein
MEYITVKEAAEKWGVTARRVQILCSQNRIVGAIRFGNRIMIPRDAKYPVASVAVRREDRPPLRVPTLRNQLPKIGRMSVTIYNDPARRI